MPTMQVVATHCYTDQTVGAVVAQAFHNVPSVCGNQDCSGQWTVRTVVTNPLNANRKSFLNELTGGWSNAGLMVLLPQPAQVTATSASLTTAAFAATASGDDIVFSMTGIAALTLQWSIIIVTWDLYAET